MIKTVLPPTKSMRKYCLERCEIEKKRVRLCRDGSCPLYPYRLGRQPNRAGIGGQISSFQKKAQSSRGSAEKPGQGSDLDSSAALGAFNAENALGKSGLNARGQIMITKLGEQGLVITLKTETLRETENDK